MNPSFKDAYDLLNKLRLVVYAMVAAPLVVFVFIYLRSEKGENAQSYIDMDNPITSVLALIAVVSIAVSFFIFRTRLKTLRDAQDLEKKFSDYFQAALIKFGLLETAMLLTVVGYFLTANPSFAIGFLIVLFIFSVENPSLNKIIGHLRLNADEKRRALEKNGLL